MSCFDCSMSFIQDNFSDSLFAMTMKDLDGLKKRNAESATMALYSLPNNRSEKEKEKEKEKETANT